MSEEFETNINETSTDVETNVTAKQEDVLIQLPAVIKTSQKRGK